MNNLPSGYVEGYYGRLFDWSERQRIVDTLAKHQMGSYLYAPKEDAKHRYRWREPYDALWLENFSSFCAYAKERQVVVTAGVAPGLDFNFSDLPNGADFDRLLKKCRKLREHGAGAICLLMDDIDADFDTRNGGIEHEGEAHALLANTLAEAFGESILVVPRIYANELASDANDYLPYFIKTLNTQNTLIYCGTDIVSETVHRTDIEQVVGVADTRIIIWDNLYANDYCTRRLFLGSWSGREEAGPVLLNPTGMINTDCLLLEVMGLTREQQQAEDAIYSDTKKQRADKLAQSAWHTVMDSYQVPEQFFTVAEYLWHPVFNSRDWEPVKAATEKHYAAIEHLLWRWKTPLSREWYPFIMALKQDLLIYEGKLSTLRIQKTQPPALATHLLNNPTSGV